MTLRILILADISSSHTEKWALGLAGKGYRIGIFSLNESTGDWFKDNKNISVLSEGNKVSESDLILRKLKYMLVLPKLWQCIKEFKPDVVHAHYATSYGLLGALSGFRPFVLSAWGSDVYEFPQTSFVHKALLKFNLKKATKILATSYVLKGELWKYTSKEIDVIPFGVDTRSFYPFAVKTKQEEHILHIGTIKAIEDKYGIKTIIEAAELIRLCLPAIAFKVFLIGSGTRTKHYEKMVRNKNLEDYFVFTGKVPFAEIPTYHNLLDILLNVSTVNESFGVSVIEGMACAKPVIVSNAPGLMEVVENNFGLIVERENSQALAKAIMQLMESPKLRAAIGSKARDHVLLNYDFENSISNMMHVYELVLAKKQYFSLSLNDHSL